MNDIFIGGVVESNCLLFNQKFKYILIIFNNERYVLMSKFFFLKNNFLMYCVYVLVRCENLVVNFEGKLIYNNWFDCLGID